MTLPLFAIIIPVHNGGVLFETCLQAVHNSSLTCWELIVVDDGSTDNSVALAARYGAQICCTSGRVGPAAARNIGAEAARAPVLVFVDADCALHTHALANIDQLFKSNPTLDAVFGSYDNAPAQPNFISQYKNLFHHYVHQHSNPQATTFWTGCGAIRRHRFLDLGGFDAETYPHPAVEDIDLGYRLAQTGGQIRLARYVQVKHLKRWTFLAMLRTDIIDRGIPWTRLLLKYRAFAADLNLQTHNRASVVLVWLLVLLSGFSPTHARVRWSIGGLMLALVVLNFDFYRFYQQERGTLFALRVIPLHWLYYFYNGISFAIGLLGHLLAGGK